LRKGFEKLRAITMAQNDARRQGGVIGKLKGWALTASAAVTFTRLYLLPAKSNEIPRQVRLVPAW
jgi:magnesium-protoporphyrin IX monomethyl ester (oxidative) cyclase